MSNKPKALYVHIPFCDHICSYCDFTKFFYFKKYEKLYLESLFYEIDSYKINKVDTIYVGGGTPTSLSDEGFEKLLKKLKPFLVKNGEFSVEANVENLTLKKLQIMKSFSVNRLSIGIQSSSNKRLKEIGRNHTFEDAKKVVTLAKQTGFENINVDFIYGFEKETLNELKKDLDNFIKLDVDHVSIYSLIISPGSILYNKNKKEQNEDDSRKYYDHILTFLRKNRYERYEISNFARDKKYSKHNITYWKNNEYYGVGLGASGYINKIRYTNTKNLNNYNKHNFIEEKEKISKKRELEYFLITNFRMENGFLRSEFKMLFKKDFLEIFKEKIEQFNLSNLFNITKQRISLNDEGLMLMDFVILKLL